MGPTFWKVPFTSLFTHFSVRNQGFSALSTLQWHLNSLSGKWVACPARSLHYVQLNHILRVDTVGKNTMIMFWSFSRCRVTGL